MNLKKNPWKEQNMLKKEKGKFGKNEITKNEITISEL